MTRWPRICGSRWISSWSRWPGASDPIRTAALIGRVLEGSGVHLPRVQHGHDTAAWPLLEDALVHGYDVRIGLEDTLLMPDGSRAQGNADLVEAAARIAAQAPGFTTETILRSR